MGRSLSGVVACAMLALVVASLFGQPVERDGAQPVSESVKSAIEERTSPLSGRATAALDVRVEEAATEGQKNIEFTLRDEQVRTAVQVNLDGEPTLARDDGSNGDRVSGDGVFTASVRGTTADKFAELGAKLRAMDANSVVGRTIEDLEQVGEPDVCPPVLLPDTGLGDAEKQRLIEQALMIIDTSVVNSVEAKNGHWSFGHLITEMVNQPVTGIDPATFVERWLEHWLTDQNISMFSASAVPVAKREAIKPIVIDPWKTASGGEKLDLTKAPLRLLAIVPRVDLRDNLVLGPPPRIGGGGAGELRFVYGVLDEDGQPLRFTIIVEYQVKREDFTGVLQWANQVYDLYEEFGAIDSAAYREALRDLTDSITSRNVDLEQAPNASMLAQIRTNEVALDPQWELREFRLDVQNTGYLKQVTVKQNPEIRFNETERLRDFIAGRKSDLLCQKHVIPIEFEGEAFLAGSALNPSPPATFFWNFAGDVPDLLEARHFLSLATCNACHGGETQTTFLHIFPREEDEESTLSGFLTGITVPDPAGQLKDGAAKTRPFNDLERRARDLKALVDFEEVYEVERPPLQMVH